jgi:transglutaminase-like putative cysteine protease
MIAAAQARALAAGAPEADVLAAIATTYAISSRADHGQAARALSAIAAQSTVSADLRGEAALAARSLAADEGGDAGVAADRALGLITDVAALGPFRDTGGGLRAKDGPEAPGASFSDVRAHYSWGSVEVSWRALPRGYVGAAGAPLDLFISPRSESCTWVASRVALPQPQKLVVRLASAGQARLVFDGVDLGASEDADRAAFFDRIAAKVDAAAGKHLVAAKVCEGALDDDGRVRLRVTDEAGAPLTVDASADISDLPASLPHVTFERVTTPLARTLTAAGGGIDARIDAAIARTLGGADDLASPRAPGILDEVVRTPGLAPDALAMAAWVAPSGANRSGWLNLARTRADAAGDAQTRAFVDRRLIAQHLSAQLADWAMIARRRAGIDRATDSEAVLLGALVDEALGVDALRIGAERRLAALVAASPATAPDDAVRQLAHAATGLDASRALAALDLLAQRGAPSGAWVEASSARGADAVVAAAMHTFDGDLDDPDEGIQAAQAVSRAGAHAAALRLYQQLVAWAPNRAEVFSGLAEELAAAPSGTAMIDPHHPESTVDDAAVIMAALRRARELAPGDARLRAEMDLRARPSEAEPPPGGPGNQGDEKYLVGSDVILARRQGLPPAGTPPEVTDREIYFLRAVVMHPDRRVSELIHYAREIVIAPRTEEELYEPYPAELATSEIVRARVHRKDGGTAFPTEERSDGGQARIRWPELSPGDTVEVAVREWTAGPVGGRGEVPFFFLDFAGSTVTKPISYNEDWIEYPPDHPIFVDVVNGRADHKDEKDEGGRHVVHLVWDNPVNVPDEPLSPQFSEVVPTVVGSTFASWDAFRAWYSEAVRGFTDPDDQVKALAGRLTRGKTTREEKLTAIFDFVADDIRYVNYESGEAWLPNRPQELLARREGDCDDKAMLLITLLKAVGIDAQEVMVQTRQTAMPSLLLAQHAAVPYFDHGIAFLPGPNGGRYLDATSPQSRLGPLPSMDGQAVALRMDGPAQIVHLPAASPDDHGADIKWTITLSPNGAGDLAGEERHSGDGAFELRMFMSEAGARAQFVEQTLVGGWFPTVAVDAKSVDFKGDLPNGQAWVGYKARSEGLARHDGTDLVVPLSPSQTMASQLAPLVTRTLPVVLPPFRAPSHESRTIKVIAPAGYTWSALPPGGDEDGGTFGRAHVDVAKDPTDPRAILVTQSFVMQDSTISVDRYAAWRTWLQRVDSLMHQSLRLARTTR